jgi:hypothetical protein
LGGIEVLQFGILPNAELAELIASIPTSARQLLAIETPQPRGQMVSTEMFETCIWIGRFLERWGGGRWTYVSREAIKLHLTGMARAQDKHIAQALKDRFGGVDIAVGGKRCKRCAGKGVRTRERVKCAACAGSGWQSVPGPLYGVTSHVWAAAAVACYVLDNPQRIQAIMLKSARNALEAAVGKQVPLTQELRREHGLAGRQASLKKMKQINTKKAKAVENGKATG